MTVHVETLFAPPAIPPGVTDVGSAVAVAVLGAYALAPILFRDKLTKSQQILFGGWLGGAWLMFRELRRRAAE